MAGPGEVTPAMMREWFPEARVICECGEARGVCPAGCSWLKRAREGVREWLARGDEVVAGDNE